MMKLVQTLPDGPLDIVGDIHGEIDALKNLLNALGYDENGSASHGRKLVFVGDFCDRGPDSPAVIKLVKKLVSSGNAFAVLGNHEINLLANDAKDGSGWFFDTRYASDSPYYAPFQRIKPDEKAPLIEFLNQLPIAFERNDIRIIHASWIPEKVDQIRSLNTGNVVHYLQQWEVEIRTHAQDSGLLERYRTEKEKWKFQIESQGNPPPFLHAIADYETLQHVYSPIKALTSGLETKTNTPFFSGNRWRFSDRIPWWDTYDQNVPVVIGHYWRLFDPRPDQPQSRYSQLFRDVDPTAWHGKRHNVFCVDYSAGARWRNRKENVCPGSRFRLAALQWPEMRLVFDSGEVLSTKNSPIPQVT